MSEVERKTEIGSLDGTPEKRMFWSIMSDYDLKTGISELIDNAIDLWMGSKPRRNLIVELILDPERQVISIEDNAGGVAKSNLPVLITPGGSMNDPNAETIGYFGVGSKRAVVALAEQVAIKTGRVGEASFQIDITKEWLESPTWELPAYQIPEILEGTTRIELSHLKQPITESDVNRLATHLGETYAWFLEIDGCEIRLNGKNISPITFERWAYPPDFRPKSSTFTVAFGEHGTLGVEILAGLVLDRDPEGDNYGVYFYCNNRLISKEVKVREVGYYVSSEAGVPHPDASLCRVIVRLNGKAKLMPWNSSKTGVNYNHPAFHQLRATLLPLVSHFSALSRRTKNDWEEKIFPHTEGEVENIKPADSSQGRRLILPPLPRTNRPKIEQLKAKNRSQLHRQPWTLGIVEAMAAVEMLGRQKLETRNRIALILLDSNFEIALKEFIVHREDLFPSADLKKLFERRHYVLDALTKKVAVPAGVLERAKHYYSMRNKLVHERATVDVTQNDIENYTNTVQEILNLLFELEF